MTPSCMVVEGYFYWGPQYCGQTKGLKNVGTRDEPFFICKLHRKQKRHLS
jgi:hypothetical protein